MEVIKKKMKMICTSPFISLIGNFGGDSNNGKIFVP